MTTVIDAQKIIERLWQRLQASLSQGDLRAKRDTALAAYEELRAIAEIRRSSATPPDVMACFVEALEKIQRLHEAYHQELQYTLEWASSRDFENE
jgi:hypothetical protein